MFDIAPTELLLVAIVALLVIGPKDLPKAMRFVGHWVGRARGVARQFRSGFDAMVREAELAEMEKKWAEENERIMREHPMTPPTTPQAALPAPDEVADAAAEAGMPEDQPLVMVEPPVVRPDVDLAPSPPVDKAAS
ncbi:Sec-independent protein translocase protein TatB [Sphingomonas sp.]|uniref:Sec-independent protein translocase protein TatB n=1 Tax=Sphingomonas sp. TaxID=28214 RepID=UPI002DD638A2|nr:Sec-independent protein translocase protein TatB [Sphingomonas sp.]